MKVSDGVKHFLEEDVYFYTALVVLTAVVSFGLGRASLPNVQERQSGSIILTQQSPYSEVSTVPGDNTEPERAVAATQLVGSRNGTKYHALWCPGALQIKEENKIYFSSEADARAKGYTQAGNCDM